MPGAKSRWLAVCAASFTALLLMVRPAAGQSFASQFGLQKVILMGEHAPGAGPNGKFHFLSAPALNNVGEVSFSATLADGTFPSGLWSTSGGSLHLVASENSEAPGFDPGIRFKSFNTSVYPIALNDDGVTTFYNSVSTTLLNNGLWNDAGGALQPTAISRVPANGLDAGASLGFINGLTISGSGAVVFDTTLTGTGITTSNNRSIWSGYTPDTLGLVAREANPAPGAPSGSEFDNFLAASNTPAINSNNQVAFLASFRGPGATATANTGMWSGTSESDLRLVALAGQHSPGMPAGVTFANFTTLDKPTINGQGEVAFRGQMAGPGSPSGINSGIWSEAGGTGLRLVAAKGSLAAGTAGLHFGELAQPVMNDQGETAFSAALSGVGDSSDDGIWIDQPDQGLRLVAQTRELAPGAEGATFRFLTSPALNGSGQVAFLAALMGTGVNGNNGSGVWIESSPGNLQLIVRAGDLLEVEPGVFKTLAGGFFVPASGEDDGLPSLFNDRGELALELRFTDGTSGMFLFVPEPSSIVIAAVGAIACLAVAGRNRAKRSTAVTCRRSRR